MGYMILKLNDGKQDFYLEWSTHTDAPRTFGMSLEEFTIYYREEWGRYAMQREFPERMERVEAKGTSDYSKPINSIIWSQLRPKSTDTFKKDGE